MSAAKYADAWPPAPNGRYRVACYIGNFADSPVIYERAASFDHGTLKAAARRLASLIARRRKGTPRYDSLYIVTPTGERLPLNAARQRLKEAAGWQRH